MNTELIARISCALGFHKMPKWGAPESGSFTLMNGEYAKNISVQRRVCEICGAIKVRKAL